MFPPRHWQQSLFTYKQNSKKNFDPIFISSREERTTSTRIAEHCSLLKNNKCCDCVLIYTSGRQFLWHISLSHGERSQFDLRVFLRCESLRLICESFTQSPIIFCVAINFQLPFSKFVTLSCTQPEKKFSFSRLACRTALNYLIRKLLWNYNPEQLNSQSSLHPRDDKISLIFIYSFVFADKFEISVWRVRTIYFIISDFFRAAVEIH